MSGTAFLPFYLIPLLHAQPKVFIHQHSGHKVMFGPFNQLVSAYSGKRGKICMGENKKLPIEERKERRQDRMVVRAQSKNNTGVKESRVELKS